MCVVDLSGTPVLRPDNNRSRDPTILYSPNVLLELGVALSMGKPLFVFARRIGGKVQLPSDLGFIRYLGLTELDSWNTALDTLEASMRETLPKLFFGPTALPMAESIERVISYLDRTISFAEGYRRLRKTAVEPYAFTLAAGRFVALVDRGSFDVLDLPVDFFSIRDTVESIAGRGEIFHRQSDGKVQCAVLESIPGNEYLDHVLTKVLATGSYSPSQGEVIIKVTPLVELERVSEESLLSAKAVLALMHSRPPKVT